MSKRGKGLGDWLSKGWDWIRGKYHENKHHITAAKDKMVKAASDELKNVGQNIYDEGKKVVMTEGKKMYDRGKALAKDAYGTAKSEATKRVKKHVDKYRKMGEAKLDKYTSAIHNKMDQVQSKINSYKTDD